MKHILLKSGLYLVICVLFFVAGFYARGWYKENTQNSDLLSPFVTSGTVVSKPLLAYSIPELQNRTYNPSNIVLEEIIATNSAYTSFVFSYQTLGKKMTGQMNIPSSITANPEQEKKVIVLLRGYVPQETYTTGVGTKNAAAVFAQAGYITLAPDFFGFGGSDPQPENSWVERFEKPITVIELLKTIEVTGVPIANAKRVPITTLGMWAHSNGGQIALTTLEILKKPIPTTLWAPVTAPFPYSVLYFSDEHEDEGKATRKWIALFEQDYDVFLFSLTQHLGNLQGPLQIQHGDNDDSALATWSQEFMEKIPKEIESQLIIHKGADHNMVPAWDSAIQNDLTFFKKWL